MVDVRHKTCKTEYCQVRPYKKYEGYCLFCFIHTYPEHKLSRNYKTKERTVTDFIKETFPSIDIVYDKKVKEGCSKRRPDVLIDLGSHVVIIEVDENQHSNYDCICENKRKMEISQDLGHRNVIFIRFNPDEYVDKGVKVKTCWTTNKSGIHKVSKTKEKEWNSRLEVLKNTIQYWIDNSTDKTVETVELFYG